MSVSVSVMGLFYIRVNVKALVRLQASGMGLFYIRVNVKALVRSLRSAARNPCLAKQARATN